MPTVRTLRDTYGGGSSRQVVNRAIRAEAPGGAELIDTLAAINEASKWGDDKTLSEACQSLEKACRLAVDHPAYRPLAASWALVAAARELRSTNWIAEAHPITCDLLAYCRDIYAKELLAD